MVRAGIAPVKLKILESRDVVQKPEASSTRPVYTVQVGAFENLKTAEDLKKQLENKKYPDVRIQMFLAGKTLYRVRAGQESDLQAAQKLADTLRKDGLQPFVVRAD